jgi:hypothetical protein
VREWHQPAELATGEWLRPRGSYIRGTADSAD